MSNPVDEHTSAPALRLNRRRAVALQVLPFTPVIIVTAAVLLFRDSLAELSTLGYLGVFLANVVGSGTFILPVPALATACAGAVIWNPILVALAGATGATIGELTGYLAGAGTQNAVSRLVGGSKWYSRIEGWVRRRGAITIFLFAVIPVPLFDVVGFASGSLGYSVKRFVAACWLGKMVKFLVVALACYWGMTALLDLFE